MLELHGIKEFVSVTEFSFTWGVDEKLGCRNRKIPAGHLSQ